MKIHRNHDEESKNNNEFENDFKNDWKDLTNICSKLANVKKNDKTVDDTPINPENVYKAMLNSYDVHLARLFLIIKLYKMRYFLFKPIIRFLHFDLIKSILFNKRESAFALLALLFELATLVFVAFYFSIHISLFVFIGFGVLYTLIYAVRRICIYIAWRLRGNDLKSYEKIDEDDVFEEDETRESVYVKCLQEEENRLSYPSRFMKKNYIAVIAFLFESAAITFTALYFSLQISLFVFIGFSLFYTLICAVRKIVNYRAEPKISTDTELDDDNASASVNSKAEEKIPLSENNLQKGKN